MSRLSAHSLSGLPELVEGADLAEAIASLAAAASLASAASLAPAASLAAAAWRSEERGSSGLRDGHVVAIAHKAVSKVEGAVVDLRGVTPSERARAIAAQTSAAGGPRKDARIVQVVLDQSTEVLRAQQGVIVCRTHHGFVCANAGVDCSNAGRPDSVIVLPRDPDASARRIRARLRELTGACVGVLVTDSFGRAWRHGQCDVAIGCAGLVPLDDWRGRTDSDGRELRSTWLAVADAIAATAELARAKDSREPVVMLEGLERFVTDEDGPGAAALARPAAQDLFR